MNSIDSRIRIGGPTLKALPSLHLLSRWLISARENFEPYGISPIGLSFQSAQQEVQYQDFILKGTVVHIRFSIVMGVILIVSFGALDPFMYEEQALIIARLTRFMVMTPASILVFLATFHSRFTRYARVFSACGLYAVGGGLSLMTYHETALTVTYIFPSIMMVMIYSFFFVGLFFRDALATSVIINIVYALAVWSTEIPPGMLPMMVVVNVSLIAILVLLAMAAYQKELLSRQLFVRSQQVVEASLHKSRFLAAASHDLRQPMHALGLFVAQLRSHIASPDGNRLVDRIDDAVTGMNELFNALLDITKLDAGALTPTIAEFPIAELLGRIGSTFAPVAQEKGLSFHSVPSSAWVRSDPVLLERIVLNLVSNAVRYTGAGGVVVGCRFRKDHVRIEVWDSGPGIPPEQQRKIFGEFYRLTDAAKTNQAGLGLGLAIVDRLSALLDHPIELTSTIGKGSRFGVRVPTAAARAPAHPKIEPPTQDAIGVARGKLVVVIDNDVRVLEGMGGLLRNWGCRVVTTTTPEAALAAVSKLGAAARPDLVISDFHLADGQTGITAIAKLREAYGAVPAFVMSGDTAPERLRETQESGHHLLHKPVQPMMLRAMVSRCLKSAHAEVSAKFGGIE
jgi:signal transduction histidine kinase/CheY-like chemotaxis protein